MYNDAKFLKVYHTHAEFFQTGFVGFPLNKRFLLMQGFCVGILSMSLNVI